MNGNTDIPPAEQADQPMSIFNDLSAAEIKIAAVTRVVLPTILENSAFADQDLVLVEEVARRTIREALRVTGGVSLSSPQPTPEALTN